MKHISKFMDSTGQYGQRYRNKIIEMHAKGCVLKFNVGMRERMLRGYLMFAKAQLCLY